MADLSFLTPVIVTVVVILLIFLAIFIAVKLIKHKVNRVTRRYLGMSASQAASFISKGLKDEATLPKPITTLEAVYMPRIQRDFPEMGYENMAALAKTTLVDYLNAIEADRPSALNAPSEKLRSQLENVLNDNQSRGMREYFDDIKIHKAGISAYNNSAKEASAVFEIAVGYLHYFVRSGSVCGGSKTTPEQAAYKVILTYSQEAAEEETAVFASNCPNCGAPVSASGGSKKCLYCGCGITEISQRVWVVTEIKKFG